MCHHAWAILFRKNWKKIGFCQMYGFTICAYSQAESSTLKGRKSASIHYKYASISGVTTGTIS